MSGPSQPRPDRRRGGSRQWHVRDHHRGSHGHGHPRRDRAAVDDHARLRRRPGASQGLQRHEVALRRQDRDGALLRRQLPRDRERPHGRTGRVLPRIHVPDVRRRRPLRRSGRMQLGQSHDPLPRRQVPQRGHRRREGTQAGRGVQPEGHQRGRSDQGCHDRRFQALNAGTAQAGQCLRRPGPVARPKAATSPPSEFHFSNANAQRKLESSLGGFSNF